MNKPKKMKVLISGIVYTILSMAVGAFFSFILCCLGVVWLQNPWYESLIVTTLVVLGGFVIFKETRR